MSEAINANEFLEELEHTHIVLFHDGNNEIFKIVTEKLKNF
ncbi:hypothetical protein OAJ34_01200 [Candidatus Nitrosopelagicus sp.]|nr:hypothetical protein [Candidatus Nitrosopelagicus sp.]